MNIPAFFAILTAVVFGTYAAHAQYAGAYAGAFDGDDTGVWFANVDDFGIVSAAITNASGAKQTGAGTVSGTGDIAVTIGNVNTGATFTGKIDAAGHLMGSWLNAFFGFSGNFEGNRVASAVVPPSITGQPQNQTANVGANAAFTVTASGTLPLTYQWRFNDTNILNATNATLSLTDIQKSNEGSYTVVVSNTAGSTTSQPALLTVAPANTPPTISHIADQTIERNASTPAIAFTVNDAETPPANLRVAATSWNQALISDTNIVLSGNGTNRTVTVSPNCDQVGEGLVFLVVRDEAGASAGTFFKITVTNTYSPPTVAIVNLADGAVFASPTNIIAVADAHTGNNVPPNAISCDNAINLDWSDSTTIHLSFDKLPSAQGWAYLPGTFNPLGALANPEESRVFSVDGTKLHQDTMGIGMPGHDSTQYVLTNVVANDLPFQLSVRARVVRNESSGPLVEEVGGFIFYVYSDKEQYIFQFNSKQIVESPGGRVFASGLDTTVFHDYRIVAIPGKCFQFFVDGQRTFAGPPLNFPARDSLFNGLSIGDGTGGANAEVEITQYEFTQLKAEPPLPQSGIAKVDFYESGTNWNWLGAVSNSPYGLIWSNASLGVHSIVALATDRQGMVGVSEPVRIVVTAQGCALDPSPFLVSQPALPVNFFDGDFCEADWVSTLGYQSKLGGSMTSSTAPNNGNPGAFREITQTIIGGVANSGIWSFHKKLSAVYSPRTQGAISWIDYAEDSNNASETAAPALEQDGQVFGVPFFLPNGSSWTRTNLTHLVATDFARLDSTNSNHPDFSTNGAPITFGFGRANSTDPFSGAGGGTFVNGIDNWSMTVFPVGTPSVGILSIADASVSTSASGKTNVSITVALAQPVNGAVSVNYAMVDGTAKAGGDYFANSGTLVIPAGTTSTNVLIQILAGQTAPADKTFSVEMSNPLGAVFARCQAQVTIHSPDRVNVLPVVGITSPTNGAVFSKPANILITATATDSDGTIAKVEFFQGAAKLHETTSAPFNLVWSDVAAGNYVLTAKATDNLGASAVSAPVNVTVNAPANSPPTISAIVDQIVRRNASLAPISFSITDKETAPGKLELSASSMNPSLLPVTNIVFGGSGANRTVTLSPAANQSGNATVTITVTDDGTPPLSASTPFVLTVITNQFPSVAITSPKEGDVLGSPADIAITATASDSDGTIARVEFFAGNTSLGSATASPFSVVWKNVSTGDYVLTAKATDNDGATTTSAPVRVSVVDLSGDVAIVSARDDAEVAQLKADVVEMGLVPVLFARATASANKLKNFRLVIFDDEGYEPRHITAAEIDALADTFAARIPLLCIGQNLGYPWMDLDEAHEARWSALTHLALTTGYSVNRSIDVPDVPDLHPFFNGAWGKPVTFAYMGEINYASMVVGSNAEALLSVGTADLFIVSPPLSAVDDGSVRSVTQNFLLTGRGDDAADFDRKQLFQNTVCWLLRICPTCSAGHAANLRVTTSLSSDSAKVGDAVTNMITLTLNGECPGNGVTLTNRLPANVRFVSAATSQGTWRERDGVVTFFLGDLERAGSVAITVVMKATLPGAADITSCGRMNRLNFTAADHCADTALEISGSAAPVLSIEARVGTPRVRLSGTPGATYAIEASNDPANKNGWKEITRVTAGASLVDVSDSAAAGAKARFYRARAVP